MRIRPYEADDVEGVRAFNERLRRAGVPFQFPKSPVPTWLPPGLDPDLHQEFFVAEEAGCVHGGYGLKRQAFSVLEGERIALSCYRLPLSEGVIDRRWSMLGLQLLRDALRRTPDLYALGMGGMDAPLAVLLAARRWRLVVVPFFFLPLRARSFLRNLRPLRTSALRRALLDAAAFSGLGALGVAVVKGRGRVQTREAEVDLPEAFGPWADEIWEGGRRGCALAAVRDARTLNLLYPKESGRFIRLRLRREGRSEGWAVLLDTRMRDHKQFGDMRVGSVIDCFARPGGERDVVAAATAHLESRGVDLVVSNQSHADWRAAFRSCAYLSAASNFVFAASPSLCRRLDPFEQHHARVHMTRGDGDGPINL